MTALAQETAFEVGPEPYRFTIDAVLRMMSTGVLQPDARVELLDGEIIQMPAEGFPHKRFKGEIARYLNRTLSDDYFVAIDSTLRLSDENAPDPDVHVYYREVREEALTAADVLLVIEIADSSISYDLNRKSRKYAQFGIEDYWVVDVNRRVTHVFRGAKDGVYLSRELRRFDQPLPALRIAEIVLTVSDLPVD